jgi:hypothetical protein
LCMKLELSGWTVLTKLQFWEERKSVEQISEIKMVS